MARFERSTKTWRASACMLAIADVAEIAAIFDRRFVLELGVAQFLLDVPTHISVAGRNAVGPLEGCHCAVEGALAPAWHMSNSVLCRARKGIAVSIGKRMRKTDD